ncbi:hypothetical protein [Leeuwenhoekiella sp. NPDC079379]|uniref:hypothetical protein n=1 Tax=Leeuwenhoekiella sp. NPDC079379 TaxID=3364122 RepID=UPI0037C73123
MFASFSYFSTMRIIALLLIFLPRLTLAQDLADFYAIPLKISIPLEADQFIGVDAYKNLYYTKDKTLFKQSTDKTIQFSDLLLGDISEVDLTNPLRITLFYAESNTAVILDNTLNEITRIKFNELENFRNVSHARTASDRRLWIFNTDLQRLELYDYQNNTFNSDFNPQPYNALMLASNFNTCWVLTDDLLYEYNQYGSLLNKHTANGVGQIQYSNDLLIGKYDGKLSVKAKSNNTWIPIKNLPEDSIAFYLNAGILYLYRSDLISTYKLNLPK